MVEYIHLHQAEFWLVLGFMFLVVEVVTGFTSGIFLFSGLGALCSGALMYFGAIPTTWLAGVAATGIASGVVTIALWKPLKRLQDGSEIEKDNSSDLVGYEFNLSSDISRTVNGTVAYSGITWRVEIDPKSQIETLTAGQRVRVSSVEVGLFKVTPAA